MVIWSLLAKDDLKYVYDFIAKDSKFYAIKILQEFIEKSKILGQFPQMGRIVPEIGDVNIREIIIYSYRMLYKITPNKIEVLAIIHAKQDFNKNFND